MRFQSRRADGMDRRFYDLGISVKYVERARRVTLFMLRTTLRDRVLLGVRP
jgi:hypothetical protein